MIADAQTARYRRNGWRILAGFTVFTLLGALSPASHLLVYLFPVLSLAIAFYLMEKVPGQYVGFTCVLYCVNAFVRRLVEWHTGGANAIFIMSAAQTVPIAGVAVFRHRWSELLDTRYRPWIFVTATILYGTLLGIYLHGVSPVLPEMLGWLSPIGFSLYLCKQRKLLEETITAYRVTFLVAVALMGIYGVYQYFALPAWDAFWMEQNPLLTSIGLPQPEQVRVFSTMNTPQPLADFLLVGILLGLVNRKPGRLLTVVAGLISLALSLARSAWVAGSFGLLFLIFQLTTRQRLRLFVPIAACIAVFAAGVVIPAFRNTLNDRVKSLTNPGQDGSVNERLNAQAQATTLFLSNPFGLGFGTSGGGSSGPSFGHIEPVFDLADNGIQEMTVSFGWFGSLVFLAGLGEGLLRALKSSSKDTNLLVSKAVIVAILVQMPVLGIFLGATGFALWAAIAFCLSAEWVRAEQGNDVLHSFPSMAASGVFS